MVATSEQSKLWRETLTKSPDPRAQEHGAWMLIAAVTTATAFLSHRRPIRTPLLYSLPKSSLCFLKNPNVKPSFSHLRAPPPMASSFVAEYAKSNRSACKTCSDNIAKNALRLGIVTKDKQRGFDATKWHHFHCFSFNSNSVSSVESIRGFDSLKVIASFCLCAFVVFCCC